MRLSRFMLQCLSPNVLVVSVSNYTFIYELDNFIFTLSYFIIAKLYYPKVQIERNIRVKHCHLIISVIILLPIAIVYGIAPDFTLPNFFDFTIETKDLKNIFRAMMGLYMSMISLWITGIFKRQIWLTATITNVF